MPETVENNKVVTDFRGLAMGRRSLLAAIQGVRVSNIGQKVTNYVCFTGLTINTAVSTLNAAGYVHPVHVAQQWVNRWERHPVAPQTVDY